MPSPTTTQTPRTSPSKAAPRARQGGGYPQPAASQTHLSEAKPDSRGAAAVSLTDAAPRPFTAGRPPEATGPRPAIRLGGSLADYDRLSDALDQYRATRERSDWIALRKAAGVCGCPDDEPPLTWATRRVSTYRDQQVSGFNSYERRA